MKTYDTSVSLKKGKTLHILIYKHKVRGETFSHFLPDIKTGGRAVPTKSPFTNDQTLGHGSPLLDRI